MCGVQLANKPTDSIFTNSKWGVNFVPLNTLQNASEAGFRRRFRIMVSNRQDRQNAFSHIRIAISNKS
jgi:hypothetical protein